MASLDLRFFFDSRNHTAADAAIHNVLHEKLQDCKFKLYMASIFRGNCPIS